MSGQAFLDYTEEKLIQDGLLRGPASSIVRLIAKIKGDQVLPPFRTPPEWQDYCLSSVIAMVPQQPGKVSGGNPDDFEIYLVNFDGNVQVNKGREMFWLSVQTLSSTDEHRFGFSDSSKTDWETTLRTLKGDRTNYCLHSLALVGTSSIREFLIAHNKPGASSQISLFTEEATWTTGRFTKTDVEELFVQFAKDSDNGFDSANIAADIFDLTLGHKVFVGACGAYIQQESEILSSPIVTVDDWKKRTTIELLRDIMQKPHFKSIVLSLNHLSPACRSILTSVLRYGTSEVDMTNEAAKFLLAEGMVSIKERREDNYVLRSLMLSSIVIPTLRLSQSVPDGEKLDLQWLSARTIENLCIRHLYSPQTLNADKNPAEYALQSEFVTIFRNLVPLAYPLLQYKILVEVKERDEHSVPSKTDFDEHCDRAEKYGKIHKCQMFMVNLCLKVTLCEYFGKRSYDLTAVNVVINPDELKGTIKYAKKDEPVSINGSEWDMLFKS
ncbi:11604_t:CDS:2 [Ambispora leptoticha]|uniref:11604_t:CDS:1 n=1 Tax=Ambispora leptoticha TaxID=144679 RepID=A0A9N8VVF0_9GLOM|nr:11604_t:CDS:2 [Ambispora leptoticha]